MPTDIEKQLELQRKQDNKDENRGVLAVAAILAFVIVVFILAWNLMKSHTLKSY
jgi:hypothetical protein